MRKAFVTVKWLQSGHDDFYNPPVQPLPDKHRWSQVANQNGMLFYKPLA